MAHKFTHEQEQFIKEHVVGRGNLELTEMFNAHFCLELSIRQIKAYKKNHGLSSGLDGRFRPGRTPFNKGKKCPGQGGSETQFKKGHKAHNWVPIGTERINGDGYIDVKIQDGKLQKNWKGKHIIIWEQHNGPIPKGYSIIFGDGNNRNFNPHNLILVSRKQLLVLNRNNLIQNDADLTRTAVIIADMHSKISERTKGGQQ